MGKEVMGKKENEMAQEKERPAYCRDYSPAAM